MSAEMILVCGLYVIVGLLYAAWEYAAAPAWNEVCIAALKMLTLRTRYLRFSVLLVVVSVFVAIVLLFVVAWPVFILLDICKGVWKRIRRKGA